MKTLFKTQMPSGQVAIASERGMVAAMEAGYDKTRHDDADEIIRRCNAFPDLLAALEGCLAELEDIANEGGQVFVEYTAAARAAIAKAKGEA